MWSINQDSKGIGLRGEHVAHLAAQPAHPHIDFLELAPENWMDVGGMQREQLHAIAQKYPLVAHGLSLSIGDNQPLNEPFIRQIGRFLDDLHIEVYSEHLSFSRDSQGYLYELLPIPRQAAYIPYLAERIQRVQALIQRPLVLENISYYHCYPKDMSEGEFLHELVHQSQCELLLDINNVYVNSHNHAYCPYELLQALPSHAIRYFHIAGHLQEEQNILLDTHGKSVSQPVIDLARFTFAHHGNRPLLLERDHHLPSLPILLEELLSIHRQVCQKETDLGHTQEALHA